MALVAKMKPMCMVMFLVHIMFAFVVANAAMELRPEHAGNRLDGIKIVRFTNDMLTLQAQRPAIGQIVLSGSPFVEVSSIRNAAAKLGREWDETLGYYYVLEVTMPSAGEVEVGLRSLKSPKAPFATTQSEMAAFQGEFRQRPSRFPDDPQTFRTWQKAHRTKLAEWLMSARLPDRVP